MRGGDGVGGPLCAHAVGGWVGELCMGQAGGEGNMGQAGGHRAIGQVGSGARQAGDHGGLCVFIWKGLKMAGKGVEHIHTRSMICFLLW